MDRRVLPASSRLVLALAWVVLGAGCAARAPMTQGSSAASGHGPSPQFTTEEQKLLACLDLQDHIVDLYTTEYVTSEGVTMSTAERVAFRDGWAEELAKRGTFERFEQSCFSGLTPGKYECGMHSQTTGGLVACMKVSLR
jgi:hypothetical protein